MEHVILVIYDIRDNKLRFNVSRFLKRVGLTRIQRSAFAGLARPSDRVNIEAGLRRITKGWVNFDIQIYVISSTAYSQRIIISEGYSLEEDEEFLI
ncbi:MAG: CRISPR-associated endonuclease Cas2 [Candidatus Nezhaarchaeales archaeon]